MARGSQSPEPTQPLLGPRAADGDVESRLHNPDDTLVAEQPLTTARLAIMAGSIMFSFLGMGLFASMMGVVLPLIQSAYELNDVQVSLIFLASPFGYITAAQFNEAIHAKLGRRGIATFGPLFMFLSAVCMASSPPFPMLVGTFALGGFGMGLLDGSWSAWAGAMEQANLISGLLHGSFSTGASFGPVIASLVLSADNMAWYHVYYLLAAVFFVELLIIPWACRSETAQRYREQESHGPNEADSGKGSTMFKYQAIWICSFYLLVYVGTETAVSGWIVSFMIRVRHESQSLASLSSSGFWGGMAVGRVALGGVTDRIGTRIGTAIYLSIAVLLQSIFMLVEVPSVSLILITMIGFFCGPAFPSAMVELTRMLPTELHVGAISFVASVGQVGGALLPFGLGALSQLLGLHVFGIVVAAQLFTCILLWLVFTRPRPDGGVQARRHID